MRLPITPPLMPLTEALCLHGVCRYPWNKKQATVCQELDAEALIQIKLNEKKIIILNRRISTTLELAVVTGAIRLLRMLGVADSLQSLDEEGFLYEKTQSEQYVGLGRFGDA